VIAPPKIASPTSIFFFEKKGLYPCPEFKPVMSTMEIFAPMMVYRWPWQFFLANHGRAGNFPPLDFIFRRLGPKVTGHPSH
jgi:hypothetical protein